jgi:hypothetical protein
MIILSPNASAAVSISDWETDINFEIVRNEKESISTSGLNGMSDCPHNAVEATSDDGVIELLPIGHFKFTELKCSTVEAKANERGAIAVAGGAAGVDTTK